MDVVRIAQRRPEITPGYDALPPLPPGTPLGRSTKAGDYPRLRPHRTESVGVRRAGPLNEGRRLPPATTHYAAGSNPTWNGIAQRRPEITPGYDPS